MDYKEFELMAIREEPVEYDEVGHEAHDKYMQAK